MLPNFLGIGANRAGSTWLFHNLSRHDDIFLPRQKELHFFDRDYDKGLAYYENKFAGWTGESAVGEITPQYLYREAAAMRIKEDPPGIKLFVSLRNPVDRAYSQYWRSVARGVIPKSESFEVAIAERDYILDYGNYFKHLTPYYTHFDRDRLLVLLMDSIKKEPLETLRQLCIYLQVKPEFGDNYTAERVNSASSTKNLARSKSLWYLQRLINRLKLKRLKIRVEKMNRQPLPPMNEETHRFLQDYYRDEILQTQDLVQLDLGRWLLEKQELR